MRTFVIQTRGCEFSISSYSHYGGGSHEKMARRIQRILSSVEDS